MPVFDAERAWLRLKAAVVEKPSHGKRELLQRMAEIEVECALDDGARDIDVRPAVTAGVNGN